MQSVFLYKIPPKEKKFICVFPLFLPNLPAVFGSLPLMWGLCMQAVFFNILDSISVYLLAEHPQMTDLSGLKLLLFLGKFLV